MGDRIWNWRQSEGPKIQFYLFLSSQYLRTKKKKSIFTTQNPNLPPQENNI